SILNNDASLEMQKRFTPNIAVATKLDLNFNNPIRIGTVKSTQFTFKGFSCFLDDDRSGNVRIYRFDESNNKTVINATAGTINYTTGQLVIENFAPTAFADIEMKITVTPDR
ncbi:MAG: hypothetical protein VW270_28200, partial [Candidatus Poseidoniales archaeon]